MATKLAIRLADEYQQALKGSTGELEAYVHKSLEDGFDGILGNLEDFYTNNKHMGALEVQTTLRRSEKLSQLLREIEYPGQYEAHVERFTEAYIGASEQGAAMGHELALVRGAAAESIPSDDFSDVPFDAIVAQARDGADRLRNHQQTFIQGANAAVIEALVQGSGTRALKKQLREQLGKTKSKADQIARTEMVSALNAGAYARYKRGGLKYFQSIATPSTTLCPYCAARNGNVYKLGEASIPWHPSCLLPGTVVNSPGIKATTRRKYTGEVITIKTAGGNEITITAKHPILTQRGWLRANEITDADYLLSSPMPNRLCLTIAPNKYDGPAKVEDLFGSDRESSGVLSIGMEVTPEDFHGDTGIGNEEIAVVNIKGLLDNNRPIKSLKFLEKLGLMVRAQGGQRFLSFSPANFLCMGDSPALRHSMHSRNLPSSSFIGGPVPFNPLLFTGRSPVNAGVVQNPANGGSGNPMFGSQCHYCLSRKVSRDNRLPVINMGLSEFNKGLKLRSLNTGPKNPFILNDLGEPDFGNPKFFRTLSKAFPSEVEADRVIDISGHSYCGYVYNVESHSGWYVANNIVTHNCRCVSIPWDPKWQQGDATDDAFIKKYKADRIAELRALGYEPNNGVAPFERMAGRTKPPKPFWVPGTKVVKRTRKVKKKASTPTSVPAPTPLETGRPPRPHDRPVSYQQF